MALIDTLEETFKTRIKNELLPNLSKVTGRTWVVVQARRTIAEQNALYAKGRTTKGEIVTNAKGGQSAHNFGLAVDLCPTKVGTCDLDWNAPDALWKALADLAEGMGLTAGYYFKSIHDAPHVEDPRWKDVQAQWKLGKIKIA